MLREGSAPAIAYIRTLSDAQLATTFELPMRPEPVTLDAMIEYGMIGSKVVSESAPGRDIVQVSGSDGGLLISINFFLGLFNLVPLLPLDGGHMAVVAYEKVRNALRRRRGKIAAGPVDYMKLMPLTYTVVAVMGAFMVLTLTADIINPIKLF